MKITCFANGCFLLFTLLALVPTPAHASLYSLAASGTISQNSSGDGTIPIGTPWAFELTYETAAPDLDSELTGSPDPTFGRFTNTETPPALVSISYKAGSYKVALDKPADFGPFSVVDITFLSVAHAIDININSALFPHLGGGPISFHADFNAFSTVPIFSSDALPTNTALNVASFDQSTVTLLPPSGVVSGSSLASFTLTARIRGDFNGDGSVTSADIPAMLQALTDLPAYQQSRNLSSPVLLAIADLDGSGKVDNSDIQPLLNLFAGAGSISSVPEPNAFALAGIGTITILWLGLSQRRPARRFQRLDQLAR